MAAANWPPTYEIPVSRGEKHDRVMYSEPPPEQVLRTLEHHRARHVQMSAPIQPPEALDPLQTLLLKFKGEYDR